MYNSIDDLRNAAESYRRHDYDLPIDKLFFDPGNNLVVRSLFGSYNLHMEKKAVSQFLARTTGSTKATDHYDMVARNFPYGFSVFNDIAASRNFGVYQNGKPKSVKVRAVEDVCRAIVSDRFEIFDSTHLVQALEESLSVLSGAAGGAVSYQIMKGTYIDRDAATVKITFPGFDGGGGSRGLSAGIVMRTGEVANSSTWLTPMIWRQVCSNGLVIAVADHEATIKLGHRISASSVRYELVRGIGRALGFIPQAIEKFIQREDAPIEIDMDVIGRFAEGAVGKNRASTFAANFASGMEMQHTEAGLLNGLTYAAHRSSLSLDEQLELEAAAGQLLISEAIGDQLVAEMFRLASRKPMFAEDED